MSGLAFTIAVFLLAVGINALAIFLLWKRGNLL